MRNHARVNLRPSDIGVTLLAALMSPIPGIWPDHSGHGWLPAWCAWPAAAAQALPLPFRRRAPLPVMAITAVAAITMSAAGIPVGRTLVGLLVATYAVAMHEDRRRSVAGLAIAAVGALLALTVADQSRRGLEAVPMLAVALAVAVIWVSAYAIRTRIAYQSQRVEAAVADERLRIARDLHDIIGHAISVIAIQSEAASRSLRHDPEVVPDFLTTISATSRQALAEMRNLLAVLRPEDTTADPLEPQPSVATLPDLAARVAAAGVPVTVAAPDELADLPAGVSLAVYRVVQEALTNVLKHAGPATAAVTVSRPPGRLLVSIVDNGSALPGRSPSEQTHGMIGMRERVGVFDGTLRAGPRAEGGFEVVATFPLTEDAP